MRDLDAYTGIIITKNATKIVMLTGVRTQEMRFATCEEVDLEKGIWEIPFERMKMRRPKIVPLSTQVIELSGYKGRATGHGFRHSMSTILHDNGFDSSYIEMHLTHVDKNRIRRIYNHAQYIEKRNEMK